MNTIKSLIPNAFYLLGYVVGGLSLVLAKIALFLHNSGTFLHIKLKTKFGKTVKTYLDELKQLKNQLSQVGPKSDAKNAPQSNNRLFSIINGGDKNEPGSKV